MKKYNPLGNCEGLYVPKCNAAIWNANLNSKLCNSDQNIQKIMGQLVKASSALLSNTNKLISLQGKQGKDISFGDMATSCIDALAILGNKYQDLTQLTHKGL